MNLQIGRVTPCAPPPQSPKPGAHGVTCPASKAWFRGSMRECCRRIPTPALSPRRPSPNMLTRFAPLNCSGGHPACRRGRASCRPEQWSQPVEGLECCLAIAAGLEAAALRHAGCPPLRDSWKAVTILPPRVGTMNRKRRQAGRTPNASRVSGTLERRGSVWTAWSLLPLLGSGSWKGNHSWSRRKNSLNGEPGPALEKVLPLRGGEGRGEGEREFHLISSGIVPLILSRGWALDIGHYLVIAPFEISPSPLPSVATAN